MKMKLLIIGLSIFLILVLVIVIVMTKLNKKEISNLKSLRLTYSTGYHMNAFVIYEIELRDGKYIASVKPTDLSEEEAKEYELSKDTIKEIERVLNKYNVTSWDGFSKSDRYVLDGDSFSFSVKYGEDKSISASGYMMWPNNYRDVRSYLDTVIGNLYE